MPLESLKPNYFCSLEASTMNYEYIFYFPEKPENQMLHHTGNSHQHDAAGHHWKAPPLFLSTDGRIQRGKECNKKTQKETCHTRKEAAREHLLACAAEIPSLP